MTPEQTIMQALFGRDVTKEIQALARLHQALGQALEVEDQLFVSANWRELSDFVSSEEGKIAVQTLVTDWKEFKEEKK